VTREQATPDTPDDLAPTVIAAQCGDATAFDRLYVTIQPGLLRYLRGLVGDDAEDVASDAWVQIVRDLPALRDTRNVRGWAAAIARHRAMDHLRHQRRRPATATAIDELTQLPAHGRDPGDEAAAALSTDAAIAFIATLPRDQAEAVLLRVVMGLDVQSTATVLGKRPGSVRVAAHRGLRRLAQRLAEAPWGERVAGAPSEERRHTVLDGERRLAPTDVARRRDARERARRQSVTPTVLAAPKKVG
jgi:RNA polymerase sigma-70 factor (ECF subfamily)